MEADTYIVIVHNLYSTYLSITFIFVGHRKADTYIVIADNLNST